MRKPTVFSILLGIGAFFVCVATVGLISAIAGPALGLGVNENFLLFRLCGLSRTATLKIDVLLFVIGGLFSGLALTHSKLMAMPSGLNEDARKVGGAIPRRPILTLVLFLSSVLVAMVTVLEVFDLIPQKTQGLNFSPYERALRLKEHLPISSLVVTPTDEYISKWTDSLEHRGYNFSVDGDGFIKPTVVHEHPDLKIVFLGGSSTETLYVDPEDRFPYLAGRLIEQMTGLKVNTYNGGQGGNHTMHANLLLLGKVIPMAPKYVVLMEATNDLSTLRMYEEKGYWNNNPYRSLVMRRYGSLITESPKALDRLADFFYAALPNTTRMLAIAKAAALGLFGVKQLDPGKVDEWEERRGHLRPFDEDMKKTMLKEFRSSLLTFVSVARAWKIVPVLMTQANRVTKIPDPNIAKFMPGEGVQRSMKMSYQAYQNLYDDFNNVIRDVAKKENAHLIDLHHLIPPSNKYLYDMVHFNGEGSKFAARIIADHFIKLIEGDKASVAR